MTKGQAPSTKRVFLLGCCAVVGVGSLARYHSLFYPTGINFSFLPSFQPSFFVVYNMVTTEVIAVFENTSDELLELFENFCDLFRNATLHSEAVQFPCSASSNNFARQIQRR